MSFKITRGIPVFDCPDHYATLGVALDAPANEIRKRYLKIARSLHPDSCGPGMDKKQASLLLSKLVNPAYETLSQDRERDEYHLLLKLVSQRVSLERDHQGLQYPQAQAVLRASDYPAFYQASIQTLAEQQYQNLEEVQQIVGNLSELNLAYLMRKAHPEPMTRSASSTGGVASGTTAPARNDHPVISQPVAPPPTTVSPPVDKFVSQYLRRADELIAKNRFNEAIKELRDALDLDPKNSQCHSVLGNIYLTTQKGTMAKVHFTQALNLNPQDAVALKGMDTLKKLEQRAKKSKAADSQGKSAKATSPGKKSFFGSLFSNKK